MILYFLRKDEDQSEESQENCIVGKSESGVLNADCSLSVVDFVDNLYPVRLRKARMF